jgi:hypothetical protein
MDFLYSNLKTIGVTAVLLIAFLIAGFLIGSLPARSTIGGLETKISRLEQRNAVLEQSLKIAELRGAAGLMSYRVKQNDYAAAAELSTGFFNGVREAMSNASNAALRENLEAMLNQRDEITAALAREDPEVSETLAELYGDFFQIQSEDYDVEKE